MNKITELDYFAARSMEVVMMETQEVVVDGFWNWVKQLMQIYLHFSFLEVKYRNIEGTYEKAAKKCYDYAQAMVNEKYKREQK
jgi:hypothetical protein